MTQALIKIAQAIWALLKLQVVTTTGAYTFDSGTYPDVVVLCNFTGAGHAVTLPTNTLGRICFIKDIAGTAGTDNITVTPAAGDIDGSATYVINLAHGGILVAGDGSNWWVLAAYNGTVI
jgi:hypothetical protein